MRCWEALVAIYQLHTWRVPDTQLAGRTSWSPARWWLESIMICQTEIASPSFPVPCLHFQPHTDPAASLFLPFNNPWCLDFASMALWDLYRSNRVHCFLWNDILTCLSCYFPIHPGSSPLSWRYPKSLLVSGFVCPSVYPRPHCQICPPKSPLLRNLQDCSTTADSAAWYSKVKPAQIYVIRTLSCSGLPDGSSVTHPYRVQGWLLARNVSSVSSVPNEWPGLQSPVKVEAPREASPTVSWPLYPFSVKARLPPARMPVPPQSIPDPPSWKGPPPPDLCHFHDCLWHISQTAWLYSYFPVRL